MGVFIDAFVFMGQNFGLLVSKSLEHLWISAIPLAISILIALPIGIWLGHIHRGEFLAVSLTNIGRALPSLALISILIGIVGIGLVNVTIALVLLAAPPLLSHAFVGVNGVPRDLTRAGRGMGLTPMQIVRTIELPLASPMIFSGLRTASVLVVSSATLATIAGGGGLGDIILNQVAYGIEGVIAAALWVAALSLLIDQLFNLLSKLLARRYHVEPQAEDRREQAITVTD